MADLKMYGEQSVPDCIAHRRKCELVCLIISAPGFSRVGGLIRRHTAEAQQIIEFKELPISYHRRVL